MPQKMKIKKKTQKPTSRLLRFYDFYGKHLVPIDFVLIAVSSLILYYSYIFKIYVQLPLLGSVPTLFFVTIAVIILHERIILGIAKKEMHQYKILYIESCESPIVLLSFSIVLSIFVGIWLINYFFPNLQIEQILSISIVAVFLYFSVLTITSALVLLGHRLMPSHVKARLCLGVVSNNLNQLNQLKSSERWKHIRKYFRWFEDGLDYCNSHIMKTLPNHPKVKEIDSYYDSAYLIALTGTEKELKDLAKFINESYVSLGKQRKDVDFRRFLKSLQHMKGRRTKEDESIYELGKLFETVPLTTRIATWGKPIVAVSITIIMVVAAVMQIMMYFH